MIQSVNIRDTIFPEFIETGVLDLARFHTILSRHGLEPAWQRFEKQFLSDTR